MDDTARIFDDSSASSRIRSTCKRYTSFGIISLYYCTEVILQIDYRDSDNTLDVSTPKPLKNIDKWTALEKR